MAIKKIQAHTDAFNKLVSWIASHNQIAGHDLPAPDNDGGWIHNDHDKSLPHQVFVADLEDLAKGKGLVNAKAVAWRFIQTTPGGDLHMFDMRTDNSPDVHTFHQAAHGPWIEEVKKIILDLKEEHKGIKEDFTLAFLQIHELHIKALWLRAETNKPADDIFIPLGLVFYGLKDGVHYQADEFLRIVQEAAKERMEHAKAVDHDDMKGS